jgi:phosphoglycerate dehydrogenase-like enzyme
MARVAVLDDWQGEAEALTDWSALRERAEVTFFREPFAGADAVVTGLAGFDAVLAMRERTLLSAAVISRLPNLKLISFTAARNAAVDVVACSAHGVLVCNTISTRTTHATAELALGLVLACARHVALGDAEIRAARFQQRVPNGTELFRRTLGVIGLGRIGSRVAGYGLALGMEVIAWSQNLTDERAREVGVARVDKNTLLARSDVISLHLVLSDRSRGIIGAGDLERMKPGAILVNTSRGPLIDQAALLQALQARRIVAGLDVFDQEPLPPDHKLRSAPNTVLTPHLGYVTTDTMTEFYHDAAENIVAWLDGKPIRVVNPEVLAQRPA